MATVIAIDDDIDDLLILQEALNEIDTDIHFLSFKSALPAIEWLKQNRSENPNLILIDFNMPHMNGLECLAQLKHIPNLMSSMLAILSTNISHMPVDDTVVTDSYLKLQKPNAFSAYVKMLKKLIYKSA